MKKFYEVNEYSDISGNYFRITETQADEISEGIVVLRHSHRNEVKMERELCWTPDEALALKRKQLELAITQARAALASAKEKVVLFEKMVTRYEREKLNPPTEQRFANDRGPAIYPVYSHKPRLRLGTDEE